MLGRLKILSNVLIGFSVVSVIGFVRKLIVFFQDLPLDMTFGQGLWEVADMLFIPAAFILLTVAVKLVDRELAELTVSMLKITTQKEKKDSEK